MSQVLAPTLKAGQIVILDNLAAYKSDTIHQVVEACGCHLLFLPSYSPDLSATLGGVFHDESTFETSRSTWP